ncbi:MAG TPA: ferritin-like domain-containing protein [Solirubrobacteraceae bacterium]|nr:ferritin-like domain-containing protein [Solirubrobacteraceae bacterium]
MDPPARPPRTIDFDIDRYLRNSRKVDLSGVEWEAIPDHPLADGDVMCLHYMMDIETHTVIYLRDLLATRAARDPYVTAFLSCWVYEELWHGEAFSDFLRLYGVEVPAEPRIPDGSAPMPTRPRRTARLRERMGVGHQLFLIPSMLGSLVLRDFVALHMTWGAINELTTLTAYHQLMRRCPHPVLHQMLRKIIQDERRHFAFYRAQAKARLTDNRRAAKVVRRALQAFWTPVGAGVKNDEEVDALALYLFGDSPVGRDAIREIDAYHRRPARPGRPDAARGRPRPGAAASPDEAGLRPAARGDPARQGRGGASVELEARLAGVHPSGRSQGSGCG